MNSSVKVLQSSAEHWLTSCHVPADCNPQACHQIHHLSVIFSLIKHTQLGPCVHVLLSMMKYPRPACNQRGSQNKGHGNSVCVCVCVCVCVSRGSVYLLWSSPSASSCHQ